ncbi:hypothetical protein FPV16_25000 [Methylobacterium sp. W2]|uniref:hypothetical protein n=1 Tax=Methylobacterium sp. W2 TaxID=2598107 RepID=UPI001D0C1BA8|nr:hypothetical protein [Methylobacterium sp. W2]MCC0809416.1 hypothetical protein [Methylobacterium sp. W2]
MMGPEVSVTDREAGIALITGQIVEAWLNRQPIKAGAVTGEQLSDVIMCVRIGLSLPLADLPTAKASGKSGLSIVS